MESMNVTGVLQEWVNADSRAATRSQVLVEYFIIPYTSTFIRFSHLYHEFYVNVRMGYTRGGWFILEYGWRDREWACHLPLFYKWLQCHSCCVCFFVCLLLFFCLFPFFLGVTGAWEFLCLSFKAIYKVIIWSLFCGFPLKKESV